MENNNTDTSEKTLDDQPVNKKTQVDLTSESTKPPITSEEAIGNTNESGNSISNDESVASVLSQERNDNAETVEQESAVGTQHNTSIGTTIDSAMHDTVLSEQNAVTPTPASTSENKILEVEEEEEEGMPPVTVDINSSLKEDHYDENQTKQINPVFDQDEQVVDENQQDIELAPMEIDSQEIIPDSAVDAPTNVEPVAIQPTFEESYHPIFNNSTVQEPGFAKLAEEPAEEPVEEPTEEPTAEPTEEPTAEPTEEHAEELVAEQPESSEERVSGDNDVILEDSESMDYAEQLNDGFISTEEDLQSVSAFYSIPIDTLVTEKELFTTLLFKLNEFEKLKSNYQILEINYEQFQHSQKKKLENAKAEFMAARNNVQSLKDNQKQLDEQKAQLESTLAKINSSGDKRNKLIEDMKFKISELEQSKLNISELLESKQSQLNSVNEEIKTLNAENKDVRKNLLEIETSKELLSSELMKYKFEINKLEREIQLLTESRSWYETELRNKIKELDEVRSEQSSRLTETSSELNILKQKYEINEASLKNYSSQLTTLTSKIEEYQFEIKNLTDRLSTQESQYLETISKKDEHIQILDKSLRDKTQRIEALNKLYEQTSEKVTLDEEDYKKKFEEFEAQLVEKDVKIEGLENKLFELSDKSSVIEAETLHISPFAQKTLSEINSQLSLTDLITDLNDLKKELIKEKRAKTKAEEELSTVLKELERKWPVLQSYKDRCDDYEIKQQKMEVIINNLTIDKKNINKTYEMLKKKLNESQLQIRNLTKYKIDLQRQLVVLLSEMQYQKSGDNPLTLEEKDYINKIVSSYGEISNLDETDTDHLITTRLSTFKDTVELIKQNERLLTVSRKLGEDLELKDNSGTKLIEDAENITIQKAKDAIAKLQEKVKNLETQLQAALNSKDLLQNLFDSGLAKVGDKADNDSNQERISSLLEEIKSKKTELAEVRKEYDTRIFELNGKIQSVTSEKAEVALKLSKEASTNELNKEKINNLNSSIEFLKQENSQLKSILETAQKNLGKLELKLQAANDSLVKDKSAMVELEIKVRSLTAEKDIWRSTENQLRDDVNRLYNEKAESNKLIIRLQTLDSERQAHFKETMQKFNNNTVLLQNQIDTLRSKCDKSNSEISNILHSKNVDSKVYQKRIDLLTDEIDSIKNSVLRKEKIIEELTAELTTLKKRNTAIDERKQSVLNSIATSTGSSDDVLVLKEELKNVLEDLNMATKDAAQYKELAIATEQQLNTLNEAYNHYKDISQDKINLHESEINSLKENISELEEERDSLKDELNSLSQSSELSKQEYISKISELNSTISTFESIKEDYEQKLTLVKQEAEIKESTIGELNELLSDKNNQLNASETINNILKKETEDLKIKIEESDFKIKEINISLSDEKVKNNDVVSNFEQEVRNDKIRISELETQNRTLLNQLEESPLSFNESDDMKNLVTYLNREKDSLTQQLNYVQGEESILRQSISMKEKEINDLKSELAAVKEKSSTIDKYSEALSKMKGEVEELKVYKENNNGLRKQIRLYEDRIKELESSLNELGTTVMPLNSALENLKKEITSKEQVNEKLNSEIQILKKQLETKPQDANIVANEEKDKQIQELQTKYEERAQTLEKLKNQFNEKIKKMRSEKQHAIDESKELAEKIKALEQKLLSNSTISKNDSADTEKLKSQIRLLKDEIHKKNIENSTIVSSNVEKMDKLNAELTNLKKMLEESKNSGAVKQQSQDLVALEQKYIKEKEEALKKFEAELKSKGSLMSQEEIEEFKKKLKSENEIELQREIEAHKVKIRAPSQAKINDIVEKRVKAKSEELDKQYEEKLKELELKNSSSTGSTSGIDFEKKKEELLKSFEVEKEELKKEIRTAVEKEKEFKEKILQGKIARLEEQIRKIEEEKKKLGNPMNLPMMPNMPNMPTMADFAAMNASNIPNMPNMINMPGMQNFSAKQSPNAFTNPGSAFGGNGFQGNANPFGNSAANFNTKTNANLQLPTKPTKRNLDNSEEPDKRTKTE